MFYACISIFVLLIIMVFCATIAAIDLDAYNFGLYIVLLCIVGTMLACALCIANPNACQNPIWYTHFCLVLQVCIHFPSIGGVSIMNKKELKEMYPAPSHDGELSPKMSALRSRLLAMNSTPSAGNVQQPSGATGEETKLPLRQESRATVAMLAPAIHIMHQVWRGMAWVADGIDEEEEDITRSNDVGDLEGPSTSDSQPSELLTLKRLSTIAESSCSVVVEQDEEEISSEFTSGHDVIV